MSTQLTRMGADYVSPLGFECIKCNDKFDSVEMLRRHISVYHLRWLPYECIYCDMFKATETELSEHIGTKHPNRKLKIVYSPDSDNQLLLEELLDQSEAATSTFDQSKSTTQPGDMTNSEASEPQLSRCSSSVESRACSAEQKSLNSLQTACGQTTVRLLPLVKVEPKQEADCLDLCQEEESEIVEQKCDMAASTGNDDGKTYGGQIPQAPSSKPASIKNTRQAQSTSKQRIRQYSTSSDGQPSSDEDSLKTELFCSPSPTEPEARQEPSRPLPQPSQQDIEKLLPYCPLLRHGRKIVGAEQIKALLKAKIGSKEDQGTYRSVCRLFTIRKQLQEWFSRARSRCPFAKRWQSAAFQTAARDRWADVCRVNAGIVKLSGRLGVLVSLTKNLKFDSQDQGKKVAVSKKGARWNSKPNKTLAAPGAKRTPEAPVKRVLMPQNVQWGTQFRRLNGPLRRKLVASVETNRQAHWADQHDKERLRQHLLAKKQSNETGHAESTWGLKMAQPARKRPIILAVRRRTKEVAESQQTSSYQAWRLGITPPNILVASGRLQPIAEKDSTSDSD